MMRVVVVRHRSGGGARRNEAPLPCSSHRVDCRGTGDPSVARATTPPPGLSASQAHPVLNGNEIQRTADEALTETFAGFTHG